jgi:hypothetical protein
MVFKLDWSPGSCVLACIEFGKSDAEFIEVRVSPSISFVFWQRKRQVGKVIFKSLLFKNK